MPIPNDPSLLPMLLGANADTLPIAESSSPGSGVLSYADGWPPAISMALKSAGLLPRREYLNAVNRLFSEHLYFLQSGGVYPWNEALNYRKGFRVLGPDGQEYVAQKPSGPDSPDGSGAMIGPVSPVGDSSGTWLSLANAGKTWVSSFDGKLTDPGAEEQLAKLPVDGLLTVDPDYDVQELPDGFDVRYVKSYDTASGNGQGRSYYIYCDVNGSDQNDGLTVEYPVKTLRQATKIATGIHASVAVKLAPGTYTINGISSPYSYMGTTNTCRFNSKFGVSIMALQSTDRPVITGDGIIFWSGYFDFYDLIFQCPLLDSGAKLILTRDDILLPSTSPAERALSLYYGSFGMMYDVLIEDNRANNLINAPLAISADSIWYGGGNSVIDSKVVTSAATRYAITLTNAGKLIQYGGNLTINDVNGRPLSVGAGCVFSNNGQAAPTGSYISPKAITY